MSESIRDWVGYERRLEKMGLNQLVEEASRLGLVIPTLCYDTPQQAKRAVIAQILEALDINDDILKGEPPPMTPGELDLLRSYDPVRGRIWDAASIAPYVQSLLARGLIESVRYDEDTDTYIPDANNGTSARLTAKGQEVLAAND